MKIPEECIFTEHLQESVQNINVTLRKLLTTSDDSMNLSLPYSNFSDLSSEMALESSESAGCASFEVAHKYYIPCLITFGLVGNFLSFVVFLTTHLKMRSSSYYLAALATADFGFLTMLLLVYLSNETRIELFNKPGWCQWLIYISSACSMLSAWFTVAFTVERFIAVQYPLQRPRMCTVSRAKTIVFIITIIALSSQTYVFVTAGIVKSPKQNSTSFNNTSSTSSSTTSSISNQREEYCDVRPEYYEFLRVVSVIDTFVSLFCPFVLIVVMNTMIVRNLFAFRQQFVFHGTLMDCVVYYTTSSAAQNVGNGDKCGEGSGDENQSGTSTNHRNGSNRSRSSQQSKHSTTTAGNSATPTTTRSGTGTGYTRKGKPHDNEEPICIQMNSTSGRNTTAVSAKNQQNITKLLLLISSMFILLNLPSYIIRIYIFFFFSIWNENVPPLLWCVQQTSMVLYYTNFSVNFLLYAVCGGTFRRCLNQMVRKHFMKIVNFVRAWFKIKQKQQYQQRSSNGEPRERLPPVRE